MRDETVALRYLARCLSLFALCRRQTCYRTQRCCGNPRDCLIRYAPMVPAGARDWVLATFDGRHGDDFETMQEEFAEEFEAMLEWRRAIARARAPGIFE